MDNENENNEKPNSAGKTPNDDIPFWLQGLEYPEEEDTQPIEIEEEYDNAWVKEIAENSPASEDAPKNLEAEQGSDDLLPGWLSQLSEVDQTTPAAMGVHEENLEVKSSEILSEEETSGEGEMAEEIEITQLSSEEVPETLDDSLEVTSSEAGFIDISEFGLAEFPDHEQHILDEENSGDEELPQWLQEMIAEPPEPGSEEIEPASIDIEEQLDESTEPVDITEEIDVSGDEGDEPEQPEESVIFEDYQDQSPPVETPASVIEEDHTPVFTPLENSFGQDAQEEEQEPDQTRSVGLPKTVQYAKFLLDQGDVKPAVKIFKTHIEQSEHLDAIKTWLIEATKDRGGANSDVWELIGDIAVQQNNPNQAFEAYMQAIAELLPTNEDVNETD